MAKSAVITYVDSSNNKGSKTITNIAEDVANSKVWQFCTALNSLSTNMISQVELVERTDITGDTRQVPVVNWINPEGGIIGYSVLRNQMEQMKFTFCVFTLSGATFDEGVNFQTESTFEEIGAVAFVNEDGQIALNLGMATAEDLDPTAKAGTFTVYIPETATSAAIKVVMTVTEE